MGRLSKIEKIKKHDREKSLANYYWYKEHNICPVCKKKTPDLGHVYCKDCRQDRNKQREKRDPGCQIQKAKKQALQEFRLANGLCIECGRPNKSKYKRCDICRENQRWRNHIYVHKIKQKEEEERIKDEIHNSRKALWKNET